ncbi:MAG: peptidoglycan DD-metalloendopeptidase family protein, partial [Campylobacterota bacterium]|nr:peptidoglycan DD-metalloendopeptidase family protein [Campylobacterota bacterium]
NKKVNFKRLKKSDKLAIKFKQKIRNGRYFGTPEIIGALLEVRGKKHFIFQNPEDDKYYDNNAKVLVKTEFLTPLRYKRISSRFTYKRWHPILHKYKTHLGVDFAAPTGRELKATAAGKIIHYGRKGGYGKTVIIRHKNGYKSLYGHLSQYNRKLRVGSRVKQGDYIGNVGSTGRSTGPHLHFGIYRNGRAVNPLKLLKSDKKRSNGKLKKKYIKIAKNIKKDLLKILEIKQVPMKIENFDNTYKMPKSYISLDKGIEEDYGTI